MGLLTLISYSGTSLILLTFPFPPEVTGASYVLWILSYGFTSMFPSPLEVNGGSYTQWKKKQWQLCQFPYPSEVNGGLTKANRIYVKNVESFRTLSRWLRFLTVTFGWLLIVFRQSFRTLPRSLGVLTKGTVAKSMAEPRFPSPTEVTGGSYLMSFKTFWTLALCFRPLPRWLGVSYEMLAILKKGKGV